MTHKEYILTKLEEEFRQLDVDEETKEMLDECYPFSCVGGPFTYLSAGDVLYKMHGQSFRDEMIMLIDRMVKDKRWFEFHNTYWDIEAKAAAESYAAAIACCDPFCVSDGDHPGWYYYDEEAFAQGPFCDPYDCYEHRLDLHIKI
jgi:hypothetical protein